MNKAIQNIYCVGRNYRLHAQELGNAVPKEPLLFTKPTHCLVPMDGRTIELTNKLGVIDYEVELVFHIGQPYEKGIKVEELVDSFSLGLDFTLRDVQAKIKRDGLPWLAAKGFRNSAPIGIFMPFVDVESLTKQNFSLLKNKSEVQSGNISDMIFSLQEIIDYCALHYGLGKGDIIYTGTPAGVGPVRDHDYFQVKWGKDLVGECTIHLTDSL